MEHSMGMDTETEHSGNVEKSENPGELLNNVNSSWDDINDRLTISRMVSHSILKGMVSAIEPETAEKDAQKELELDKFKETFRPCHMGAIGNDSSNVLHDELCRNRKSMTPMLPELITDVLARLPSKSVLRFKSLSKWFCHEIDDPNFVKMHLHRSLKSGSTRALIFRRNMKLQYQYGKLQYQYRKFQYQLCEDLISHASEEKFLTLVINSPVFQLSCSCNGLVVLSDFLCETFLIWNPNTRKHRIVTGPGPYPKDDTYDYVFGLGYDSLSNDYKLVWMVHIFGVSQETTGVGKFEIWVYSFKFNVWRRIKNNFDWAIAVVWRNISNNFDRQFISVLDKLCVVAHDALHFVFGHIDLRPETCVVLAFDLHTEEFRQLASLPNDALNDYPKDVSLKILGGELCVVFQMPENREIEVWKINDYGGEEESWTKIVRLRCPHLRGPRPSDSRASTLEYLDTVKEVMLPRYWRDFEWLDFEMREMFVGPRLDTGMDEYCSPQFTTLLVDSIVSVGEADGRNATIQRDMDAAE